MNKPISHLHQGQLCCAQSIYLDVLSVFEPLCLCFLIYKMGTALIPASPSSGSEGDAEAKDGQEELVRSEQCQVLC